MSVATSCCGASGLLLARDATVRPLSLQLGLPASDVTALIDLTAALVLIVLGLGVLIKPQRLVLVSVAAWFALLAVLKTVQGGAFWYVEPLAGAIRYLAPIVLMMLLGATSLRRGAEQVMRVAVALTFAAHGIEALGRNPQFESLLRGTAQNLFGWQLSADFIVLSLTAIGTIDVLVALLVLAHWSWRPALIYMSVWGLVTAASRMTAHGPDVWYETFMRLPHAAVPMALLILQAAQPVATVPHAADSEYWRS